MGCGASTGATSVQNQTIVNTDPMQRMIDRERNSNVSQYALKVLEKYKGNKPSNRRGHMMAVDEIERKLYVFGGKHEKSTGSSREEINKRAIYCYSNKKWDEITEAEMSGDMPPLISDGTFTLIKRIKDPAAYAAYYAKKRKQQSKKRRDRERGGIGDGVVVGGNLEVGFLDETNTEYLSDESEDDPEYYNTRIVLVGGIKDNGKSSGDIYIYYPDKHTWQVINLVSGDWVDHSLSGHSAVVYRQSIYIFGGMLDKQDLSRRVFTLNVATNGVKVRRHNVPSFTITKRKNHAAAVHGHHMYIVGGETRKGPVFDCWRYDLRRNEWDTVLLPSQTIPPLVRPQLVCSGDSLFLYGGVVFARLKIGDSDSTWVTVQVNDEDIPCWTSPAMVKIRHKIYCVATHPSGSRVVFGHIHIYDSIKALKDKSEKQAQQQSSSTSAQPTE